MVSIYSSDFLDTLLTYIDTIIKSTNHSSPYFNLIIEVLLETGQVRTVGNGFIVEPTTDLVQLKEMLVGFIENFETQSGTPEERQQEAVISSLIKVMNRSNAPNVNWNDPLSLPQGLKAPESSAKPSRKSPVRATAEKLAILNSQLNSGFSDLQTSINTMSENIVTAIKSQAPSPTPSGSIDWKPIVQAVAQVAITSLGGSVQPPVTPATPVASPASTQSGEVQVLQQHITALEERLNTFESALTSLVQSQASTNKTIENLASSTSSQISALAVGQENLQQTLDTFLKAQISSKYFPQGGNTEEGGSNGSPSTPTTPVSATPAGNSMAALHAANLEITNKGETTKEHFGISGAAKFNLNERIEELGFNPLLPPPEDTKAETPSSVGLVSYPEIEALPPTKNKIDLNNKIVCADLESLILPNGKNRVYMAAWYNGTSQSILDITQWGNNTQTMLEQFWIDLLNNNIGRTCYFHNFGGYDAILAMPALINLPYLFEPIMKDGEVISIRVTNKGKVLLTIKDSLRILPGSLAKLAKDWGATTQKDHFPHYFWKDCIEQTLSYFGPIPAYEFFEPKRTSLKEYEEMKGLFPNNNWSFLEVSKKYIMGDCIALYQVLVKYFETVQLKFPIDPLKIYSAPSASFRIWRTQQLPLLKNDGLKVYDLSHNLDSELRNSYCGGIVDVYRPHLIGEGFYYDVNSLYPSAMCEPMPVGHPRSTDTLTEYQLGEFFGFVEATVQAPENEYIGLLPIKHQGRLICPGGTFKGLFFSEELKFALNNKYKLLNITKAYKFQKGVHTFLELITQLNDMKITAQLNNQPTIRNLAKLLMNSMYGRFGMHPSLLKHNFWTTDEINEISSNWTIQNRIDYGELSLVTAILDQERILKTKGLKILTKELNKLRNNTNVAIASAVTAHSRMLINSYKIYALQNNYELYYSDTDSLVLNKELPPHMVDSTTLGKLKLEHHIREGIFVMPKVYYLEDTDGNVISKCKGYPGKLSRESFFLEVYLVVLTRDILRITTCHNMLIRTFLRSCVQ